MCTLITSPFELTGSALARAKITRQGNGVVPLRHWRYGCGIFCRKTDDANQPG